MTARERRACKRVTLNHPVMLGTGESKQHLAEILDANVKGLRVRMTNQSGFQVGREVNISCLSLQNQSEEFKLRCRVAWEDTESLEVGLDYQ